MYQSQCASRHYIPLAQLDVPKRALSKHLKHTQSEGCRSDKFVPEGANESQRKQQRSIRSHMGPDGVRVNHRELDWLRVS